MKKVFLTALIFTQFILPSAPDWDNQFDSSGYTYSMDMTVIVVDEAGNYIAEENEDMLAAFDSSGNIRGVGFEAFVPFNIGDYGDEKLFMIQIFSNSVSGEEIRFKFYDTSEDHIYTISDETTVIFNDQTYPGSFTSPHHLIIQDGLCPSPLTEYESWGKNILYGQSDLNEWKEKYGNCASYSLHSLVLLNNDEAISIEGVFSGLKSIETTFEITNYGNLTTINDFENLSYVGGLVEFINVDNLSSIQGLGSRGISVLAFEMTNAHSFSNCQEIPLFNCNMTIRSVFQNILNFCDNANLIGCDGQCESMSSPNLALVDCYGTCGGGTYPVSGHNCYEGTCNSGILSNFNHCHDNGCTCEAPSVTQDCDAAYAAGAASVTPDDGITQEDVDNAAVEAYIQGAQSGDISGDGNLNITDIVIYIEKILED